MARFVKKLGTLPSRYMFEMTLHKVELHVPYEVEVSVILKRGKPTISTNMQVQNDWSLKSVRLSAKVSRLQTSKTKSFKCCLPSTRISKRERGLSAS